MTFETAMAQMRELARAENVRAGLSATPIYDDASWGDRPKPPGRPKFGQSPAVAARRRKIMDMLAAGLTRRQIAHHFGCGLDRIKSDIYLWKKLGGGNDPA